MEGNPSGTLEQQVAYLLTQVSSLVQANQDLTTALDAQTQKLLLLEASVQGEVANLTTNQDSLQTILSTHSQSLSNETAARGVVDNGLTTEVVDLKDQHLNDHTYLIGLVENHHGEWMAASASHTVAMIDERQARLVGDETNASRIESVHTELVSKVDALDAEVATYNDVLDFTTMDTLDLTMDSDYPLDWSLLSASQEWRFEIDEHLRNAQKVIDTRLAAAEAVISQASQEASQALANTDITSLRAALNGQIGISALDAALTGKVSEIDAVDGKLSAVQTEVETYIQNQLTAAHSLIDSVASDLLGESQARIDALASEAQVRLTQIATLQDSVTSALGNKADASAVSTLETRVLNVEGINTSQGTAITGLQNSLVSVNDVVATKADSSAIATTNSAVTALDDRVTANSSSITSLQSSVDTINTTLPSKVDASVLTSYYTKAEADAAFASTGTDLTTTVNEHSTTLSEHSSSINGIEAVKTVTVDNNGILSGYGLISQLKDGQVTSGFGINADQFYVGAPASGNKPFLVLTSQQTINGKSYPAGTWIDAAYIANATIGNAQIANLSIDSSKIADLAVGTAKIVDLAVTGAKIANATIGSAQIADAAITSAKIGDAQITNAKVSNGAIGSINIVDGAVTTAKIGDLQVDTLKIKDDAVTVSSAASATGATVQLTVSTNGGKVRIEGAAKYALYPTSGGAIECVLYRNNVAIYTWVIDSSYAVTTGDIGWENTSYGFFGDRALPLFVDTPAAGTHTYKIVANAAQSTRIGVMEVKK